MRADRHGRAMFSRDLPRFGSGFQPALWRVVLAEDSRHVGFPFWVMDLDELRKSELCLRTWDNVAQDVSRTSTRAGAPVHDDLVRRRFGAAGPDRLWFIDITEHPTSRRFVVPPKPTLWLAGH